MVSKESKYAKSVGWLIQGVSRIVGKLVTRVSEKVSRVAS